MKTYKIYPPIGIGRVGESPAQFVRAPQTTSDGDIGKDVFDNEVTFKDQNGKIKRQAVRYWIFEFDDTTNPPTVRRIDLTSSNVNKIVWTCKLAHAKNDPTAVNICGTFQNGSLATFTFNSPETSVGNHGMPPSQKLEFTYNSTTYTS